MENQTENQTEQINALTLKNASVQTITNESNNLEQIFEDAEQMQFQEETREYLSADKFTEGQSVMLIYEGMSEITIPETGEVKSAVLLRSRNGSGYITSARVIVNALSRVTETPELVKIQYLGKKGSGSTKYADFKVFTPIRQK